jgi:hypothetical protein
MVIDVERFITEILPKAAEIEKKLPQLHLRLPASDFLDKNDTLWQIIRSKITDRYTQHTELLSRNDLAYRVIFRPTAPNATLPGFSDTHYNTRALSLWYGMDYQPKVGEYVGMVSGAPWAYYMLPDVRYANPTQYRTVLYVYDNKDSQLVKEGQTTVGPLPADNYLTGFLKMIVTITWVNVESNQELDPLVHDSSLESLADFIKRTTK